MEAIKYSLLRVDMSCDTAGGFLDSEMQDTDPSLVIERCSALNKAVFERHSCSFFKLSLSQNVPSSL